MNFQEWMESADMPQQDLKGQWFDLETGLYFDPNAVPLLDYRLPQYFAKRVSFEETKRGDVLITIRNSSHQEIGNSVMMMAAFLQQCPDDPHAAVAWACQRCGFSMEDTPEPIRKKRIHIGVLLVDTPL